MADVTYPPALAALFDAGRAVGGEAPSTHVNVGRLDGVVRPGLVPPVLRAGVTAAIERSLATTARPLSAKDVEKQLRSAWEESPAQVLDDIDLDKPLAIRPHAQTHAGVLGGEPVAVKVARPRVVSAIRTDLLLLDALAYPLGSAFPALDATAMLREIRERVLDELDLEHEGEVHRRVARGLRKVDGVTVAKVHGELTTHDVHVSARLEGPTLAEARPDDPGAVARTLVRVYAGAPKSLGMVLANPRPNDVVLLDDGGIGLIGPGAARQVAPARHAQVVAAAEALQARDVDAFADAIGVLGVLQPAAAAAAYGHIETILGPLMLNGPARLDDAALAAAGEDALGAMDALMSLAAQARPDPADVWPARMMAQLTALLAVLEAEEDWLELTVGALRDGWR